MNHQDREQKIAVVSLIKNPGPLLHPYLNYHLEAGVDHFFLFFDDPDDPAIAEAGKYKAATVIRNDEALQRVWETTEMYKDPEIRQFAPTQLIARQSLIVEVAVGLALKGGYDWLLHIDCDELFYSPRYTVKEHFRTLARQGIQSMRYINYEVLPESADVWDPFLESTLFKRSTRALPEKRITEEQQRLIDDCPQLPKRMFNFYGNGKSAVRLRPGVLPNGPHAFSVPEDRGRQARLHRRVFGSKPMKWAANKAPNFINSWANALYPYRRGMSSDPIILHYPICGFENFWLKYRTLGNFSGAWYDRIDIASSLGSLTIESRDVVAQGDRELAKAFYEQRVVLNDPEKIDQLIQAGLCCRIEGPSKQLRASSSNHFQRPIAAD